MQPLSKADSINDLLQKDEQSLLQHTAAGSTDAYTVLYRRYLQRIMNYMLVFTNQDKAKADDVVQEVFISVWESRENLIAVKNFEAYLKRSARNRLLNRLKHDEFRQRLHNKIENVNAGFETEDAVEFKTYYNVAQEAIKELPDKRRLVFLLSTAEGLSFDQIAEVLNISKSRVKQQLYQAIAQVKQRVQNP